MWSVLKKVYGDDIFELIETKDIEAGNLCETFDSYGNMIGCYNAGCYSIDNDASDFRKDLSRYLASELQDDEIRYFIYSGDFESELREYLLENFGEKAIEIMDEFIETKTIHTKAAYFTYWNGHSFKSVILDCDHRFKEYELLDKEDDEAKKILAAWKKIGETVGRINKMYKLVFTTINGVGYLFTDDRGPEITVEVQKINALPGTITLNLGTEKKEIKSPYWVGDNFLFFIENGKIYRAKRFVRNGRVLFEIDETNEIDLM